MQDDDEMATVKAAALWQSDAHVCNWHWTTAKAYTESAPEPVRVSVCSITYGCPVLRLHIGTFARFVYIRTTFISASASASYPIDCMSLRLSDSIRCTRARVCIAYTRYFRRTAAAAAWNLSDNLRAASAAFSENGTNVRWERDREKWKRKEIDAAANALKRKGR